MSNQVNMEQEPRRRKHMSVTSIFLKLLLGVLVIALVCAVISECTSKNIQMGGFSMFNNVIDFPIDSPSEVILSAINTIGIN